jgi:hypothetical protein
LRSYIAAGTNQVNHLSQSKALLKLEATVNAAMNNATATLSPIFASNPKFSNDLFLKIKEFKISFIDDLKNTTLTVINTSPNKKSLPEQLFLSWKQLLIGNLAKFASAVDFSNFQDGMNQKEHMIHNLKGESLKLKGLLGARLHKFLSFSKRIYKRSLGQNVFKGILLIITGITTILGSWIILALYAISFIIGTIIHRVSIFQEELGQRIR